MSPLSPTRVLVTDDDNDTLELIDYLLSGAGYEVTTMNNFEGALNAARTGRYSLYVLDNWLLGYSGVELCRKLREFDPLTPILFCSGAAFEEDRLDALKAGAQAYLLKPVDTEEFLLEVNRLTLATSVVAVHA